MVCNKIVGTNCYYRGFRFFRNRPTVCKRDKSKTRTEGVAYKIRTNIFKVGIKFIPDNFEVSFLFSVFSTTQLPVSYCHALFHIVPVQFGLYFYARNLFKKGLPFFRFTASIKRQYAKWTQNERSMKISVAQLLVATGF